MHPSAEALRSLEVSVCNAKAEEGASILEAQQVPCLTLTLCDPTGLHFFGGVLLQHRKGALGKCAEMAERYTPQSIVP